MLALARWRRRLLMVDEPFLGLAPHVIEQMSLRVRNAEGRGHGDLCSSNRTYA